MHTHKISNQKHIHFLKEERKDPITGDLIVEGDEVVFCAECKSAFLKESWEYMGKRHCESKKTLYIFPQTKTIIISKILFSKTHSFILSKKTNKDKLKETLNKWEKEKQNLSVPKGTKIKQKKSNVVLGNFDLEKSPILNITLIISFIICILLMANLTGIEQNIAFVVTSLIAVLTFVLRYFYPQLFFDIKEVIIQVEEHIPVLFFEKDKLCLYFHDETMCYRISYKKIEHIKFYYPTSIHLSNFFYKIDIHTIDNEFFKLELKKQIHNKNLFLKQTENIMRLVQSNSKDTSITFKVSLSKPMFYQLNEIRSTVENTRME